jgi:hypothetical protein
MGFVLYCHQPPGDGLAINAVRLGSAQSRGFLVLRNENWINFHKAVLGFLKKEFKVEGIMGGRFKPYSYVLGSGERV